MILLLVIESAALTIELISFLFESEREGQRERERERRESFKTNYVKSLKRTNLKCIILNRKPPI